LDERSRTPLADTRTERGPECRAPSNLQALLLQEAHPLSQETYLLSQETYLLSQETYLLSQETTTCSSVCGVPSASYSYTSYTPTPGSPASPNSIGPEAPS